MVNKKGTSLLTFSVYLMLFSMVTFFMCHLITFMIIPSMKSMRQCQALIALHIATDLFVRDIKTIKEHACEWKITTVHELVWNQDNQDIGWRFCDNRLERKEKGVANIITKGVAQATFVLEKEGEKVTGVELTLKPLANMAKTVTCYVALTQNDTHEE